VRAFTTEVIVPRTPVDTRVLALEKLSKPLRDSGYELAEQAPAALTFDRQSPVRWPLSLLFRQSSKITMTFDEQPGNKTRMVVAGTAPRRIAREFEKLGA
jgi:hypothetical protein